MTVETISLAKAAPLIAKLASAFATPAKGAATKAKEKLEVKFQKGFSRFIEENINRFSTVKTIISSNIPIPFSSLYVNLYVARPGFAHRDEDFLKEIERYKSVLFTATAGSGKSMLMRYLYLRFLEIQSDRLPVFIELRELAIVLFRNILLRIFCHESKSLEGAEDNSLSWPMPSRR